MKALSNVKTFLRNDEQKIVANGYPDLCVYSILGGAVESIDVEMLLYPLEEKFNLPAFPIEFRNGKRIFYGEVVGQESIDIAGFIVFIDNESHGIRVFPGGDVACEPYCLIGENPGLFINWPGFKNFIDHVVFGSGDEVSILLPEAVIKLLKCHIPLVYQVESSRFNWNPVHHLGVVYLAGSKQDKDRNRASEVHKSVHFERTPTVVELSPRTQLETEFYCTAIECIYHLLEIYAQLLSLIERCGFLYKNHRKVLVYVPISLLVGLCKGGSGHCLDARPIEVGAEIKSRFDVPQTRPVCELGKAHHHKLVTSIILDGVTVTFIAVDTLLELVFVNERHNLRKDGFSFVHGLRMVS